MDVASSHRDDASMAPRDVARARVTLRAGILAALCAAAPASASWFKSPLQAAVESGDAAKVSALLDKGADVNGTFGSERATPLKAAVKKGNVAMAKFLLDRGADVNVRRNGTSALTLAAISGSLAMTDLLLSRGAEVTERELRWAQGTDRGAVLDRLREAARRQARDAASAAAAAAPSTSSAAAADADAPAYKLGERPDDFALVVGIETYMDAPKADGAENDAAAMRRHLEALGWPSRNILALSGARAGRAGLEKYLERWLPNNVGENGRVFFYFAGDGAADPKTGRAYLLPWDGDPALLESTGYPLSRLFAKLQALKARSVVVVVDAGFSGGARAAAAPGSAAPAKLDLGVKELGDGAALLAVSDGDGAGALAERGHGALTYYLLKGLNGEAAAPSGAVTLKGLFGYARKRVADAAAGAGLRQTPQLMTGTLGEGDLKLR
jgi:hypothetical protein